MTTVFRVLLWLLALVSGIAAIGAGFVYYLASHSLPDYSARHSVRKLDAPVEIVRDSHAIPHIFAESDRAVLFGLGFAHAQDRLWQMTMMRRTVQGRLSELFGARTVPVDELMRALDLYGASVRSVTALTEAELGDAEAYAAGVNAYLALIEREALGRGAPEFFLFETPIAPWTPADSIAVIKLMALQLSDKARTEVLRAELSLRLDEARIADLLPDPTQPVIDLPEFAAMVPGAAPRRPSGGEVARLWPPMTPLREAGAAGASNAFAAAGSRAAAGAPLLASDPHLGLSAPSIWMLARLELSTGGVIGATIPGLPGVLIGRNPALAWGLTTAYLDDQDIVVERLDPARPGHVIRPDGFEAIAAKTVLLEVAGEPSRRISVERTTNGPLIPAPHFGIDRVLPAGHRAALSWTALSETDRSLAALLGVMRARSIGEAIRAAEDYVAPAQNLVLASRTGIALQVIGHAPDRAETHQTQGRMAVPGWLDGSRWQGIRPYAENPSRVDPAGGIILNTNNQTAAAPFPRHISFDWGDRIRVERASTLLGSREFHTLESFIEVQTDTVSPAARRLVPLIARNLWFTEDPAAEGTAARRRADALEALAAWSGDMTEHGFEPLVYAAWVRALQRRLISDELGAYAETFRALRPAFLERVFRDINGAGVWCDVIHSDPVETCETIARQALDAALIDLSERYGSRMESWRWGAAHQALHHHQVLGGEPWIGWAVNIEQDTPGGDFTMLRGQSARRGAAPFANVHAAGFRMVVDFADPDASVFVMATGQSGHPLSRHYDDLSVLWRRSEYVPMSLDPVLARGGAVGVTELVPAR